MYNRGTLFLLQTKTKPIYYKVERRRIRKLRNNIGDVSNETPKKEKVKIIEGAKLILIIHWLFCNYNVSTKMKWNY